MPDLIIHVNGQQTFFLDQRVVSKFSGRLRRFMVKRGKRLAPSAEIPEIRINNFPGGAGGFELVSRFCYNNGGIELNPSNACLLHCCAHFLQMTGEEPPNLLPQTASFLASAADWSWSDALLCLKSLEPFFPHAHACGLAQKLVSLLVAKLSPVGPAAGQGGPVLSGSPPSSSSQSSSPETTSSARGRLSSSSSSGCGGGGGGSGGKAWWFDDLTVLPPAIVEMTFKALGEGGTDCTSLLLTRFLLHYLKAAAGNGRWAPQCGALADTAVFGVVLLGRSGFSCRGLFWVLRVVAGFGLSGDCRAALEGLIGEMLDQATLDDLLVRDGGGGDGGGAYDVDLVQRLVRVFVGEEGRGEVGKLRKVGRLIDKYLGEIAPDQRLEVTKFLGVTESLPDSARDCFDGVYRAIDIYLLSHPHLPFEERSRLCRCLNYDKLTLEACKDLAKNPRIPPRIAIEALMSQSQQASYFLPADEVLVKKVSPCKSEYYSAILYDTGDSIDDGESFSSEERAVMRLNLQKMQNRVVELEKVCREMKGQMTKMIKNNKKTTSSPSGRQYYRTLPRLC